MTTAGADQPTGGELQFDKAETAASSADATGGTPKCATCQAAIVDQYFDINGTMVCAGCRIRLAAALTGGSGSVRFARAALAGTAAGAVGAGIYYGIAALTGYEIGLVAIVVGLMVGAAVRWGADRRGGWVYQGLAMFLTYTAIVATYVPAVIKSFKEQPVVEEQVGATELGEPGEPGERERGAMAQEGEEVTDELAAAAAPADPSPPGLVGEELAAGEPPGPLGLLVGLILVFVIAFVAPFLAGFDNIIGIIIIGIGVYEAWKLNKRVEVVIQGPLRLGAAAPTGQVAPSGG